MQLSNNMLEAMGYLELPESDELLVRFSVVKIYSVQGIHFERDGIIATSDAFEFGEKCKVSVAQSINEASNVAVAEDFTKDEEKWATEKKSKPPYVFIHFQGNAFHSIKGGHRQILEGEIHTYDSLNECNEDIDKWETEELPNIIASLSVHFSTLNSFSELVKVDSSTYGKTPDGTTVFNSKFISKASVYNSLPKSTAEINLSLQCAVDLHSRLNGDISRHMYMALEESDTLKKFLYYFLFIERFTHSQFKLIDFNDAGGTLLNLPARLKSTGLQFFKARQLDSKNIAQRFHWCSLLLWESINDDDVCTFNEMKKIRNKISHGEHVNEKMLPVAEIKLLALKLLDTKQT